jgi:hypothetical protein
VDSALIASAALLGLAGTPHCAAMCGAPCAAAVGSRSTATLAAFHLSRVAGYALGGALAASSVGALAALSQVSPVLRPLWTLLHALAFVLGIWLLWYGRQPAWMGSVGRVPAPSSAGGEWQRVQGPLRAVAAGGLWVAWPCGLLQSALLVAAMTGSGTAGAAAMAAFAVASSGGLLLAPWVWHRYLRGADAALRERWIVRSAGVLLVGASSWALGHGLWQRLAAYCGLA